MSFTSINKLISIFICSYFSIILFIRLLYEIPYPNESIAFPTVLLCVIFLISHLPYIHSVICSIIVVLPWIIILYDIGFVAHNCDINMLRELEAWCSSIYIISFPFNHIGTKS